MCGIVAYSGTKHAIPLLLDGLRALEYRGYDSAGIATSKGVLRAVGPIEALAKKASEGDDRSGIGHTRWATHGAPTKKNAHPHTDASGRIVLVHNGIIENYDLLKAEVLSPDIRYTSDTDTEVLAHLIAHFYDNGGLKRAVRRALEMVRGTYGIAVLDRQAPEEIVVARMGSPVVLGRTRHGTLAASDASALLSHTKEVGYLEDGEMALIAPSGYTIISPSGRKRKRATDTIEWDVAAVQKEGYAHFMEKEIMEAPQVIENTIRGRLLRTKGEVKLGGLQSVAAALSSTTRLRIIGCGSAYYAGCVGKYLIETYAGIPVEAEIASEYRYRTSPAEAGEVVLAVSQSGETADTLASVRAARANGQLTLGVVNVVGASIARETDAGIYNHAGPEVSVASTKAFISQVAVFALLALFLGRMRTMPARKGKELAHALSALPRALALLLQSRAEIARIARAFAHQENALYIGRTYGLPIAQEGALKLKEVAYVHAEAYGSGEMKHGPIAMIDEQFPTVAVCLRDEVYDKNFANIEEIKARKGPVLALATERDERILRVADEVIFLPDVHPVVRPIIAAVPLHLFAYYVGVARGLPVDRPRNLAKSVTVE